MAVKIIQLGVRSSSRFLAAIAALFRPPPGAPVGRPTKRYGKWSARLRFINKHCQFTSNSPEMVLTKLSFRRPIYRTFFMVEQGGRVHILTLSLPDFLLASLSAGARSIDLPEARLL